MNEQEIQMVKERLRIFRETLPVNPREGDYRVALLSDLNPSQQKVVMDRDLNVLNDSLKKLEEKNYWHEISLILEFYNQQRRKELFVIVSLINMNRLLEVSKFLNLIAQNKWNDVYIIIQLAANNQWDSISRNLEKLLNPPSLFNLERKEEGLDELIGYTAIAGLTDEQSRNLNEQRGRSLISISENKAKALDNAQIEILKQRELNNEALRYARAQNDMGMVIPLNQSNMSKIDYVALEKAYIEVNRLIRLGVNETFEIYKWDEKTKRYMKIDTNKTLATDINSYAYQAYGNNIEITQSQIDVMVNRMRHSTVPLLENSAFASESYEKQLFFLNGYYDFRDNRFYEEDTSQWFHTFTMSCNYYDNVSAPIFDEMLKRAFDADDTKIKLAYQIIGAIISNVTLKYIYVFQGKSHGGKSTIAECIERLLNEDEVKFIGSMNELDETRARAFERRVKLLYIDDAPSDKWSSSTISYLKTRSRGISRKNQVTFKILLNTNYEIGFKTENGRDESMENRILVLPFEKDMKTASEYEYVSDNDRTITEAIRHYFDAKYEEEKMGIIIKAIQAFQEVINNNGDFVYRYPLNGAVTSSKVSISIITKEDKEKKLREFLLSNFEMTNNENEYTKADDLLEHINREISKGSLKYYGLNTFDRPHEVGKLLKTIWGEEIVCDKRRDDKTYYKLRLKSFN